MRSDACVSIGGRRSGTTQDYDVIDCSVDWCKSNSNLRVVEEEKCSSTDFSAHICGASGSQNRLNVPASCADIKKNTPLAPDGIYDIQPDPMKPALKVFCDMTSDSGGWSLVMKTSSGFACSDTLLKQPDEEQCIYSKHVGEVCRNAELLRHKPGNYSARVPLWAIDKLMNSGASAILKLVTNGNENVYFRRKRKDLHNSIAKGMIRFRKADIGTIMSNFDLYSSYNDAINMQNNWLHCTYEDETGDGSGFPLSCGPNSVGNSNKAITSQSCTTNSATSHIYIQAETSELSICAEAYQGKSIELKCPPGHSISDITFASYGLPMGTCGSYSTTPSCHSSSAITILKRSCLNKAYCRLQVDQVTFGNPCNDAAKRLSVAASCSESCGLTVCKTTKT